MKKLFHAELEPIVKKSNFVASISIIGEAKNKIEFTKKIQKEIQSDKKIISIMEL